MATKTTRRITKSKLSKSGKKVSPEKKHDQPKKAARLGAKVHNLVDQLPANRLSEVTNHLNDILAPVKKTRSRGSNVANLKVGDTDIVVLKEARDAIWQAVLSKDYE